MQIKIRAAAALALLAITAAATAVQFGDYRTTGFLSDYSKLRHQPGTDADSWSDQSADLGKYDKVIIDRIKIYLKDDAKSKEMALFAFAEDGLTL